MNEQLARVVAQHRGKYRLKSGTAEFWAEVTGKIIFNAAGPADYPVVGDLVSIVPLEDEHAIINDILPRHTLLQRKAAGQDESQLIAANLDEAFIVQGADQDFNLNRLERYLTIIRAGRITPAILLNKADLLSPTELAEKRDQIEQRFKEVKFFTVSALQGTGLAELRSALQPDRLYCFVGSSGAGKSSLINQLLGKELLKTKELSSFSGKGQHTTTHRELFVLENGSMVIDNPGIREVGLTDTGQAVAGVFSEFSDLATNCRFADCTHTQEPGCAVLAALAAGELSPERYENYLKLKKEADHYAASSADKKRRARQLGRLVKQVKKIKGKNRR